jgi:hypothetical protein
VNGVAERLRRLLPAVWLGLLLAVAAVATPAPFALLARADAGRVVARVLAQEAWISLVIGLLLLMLERRAAQRAAAAGSGSLFGTGMLLALGTLFCTVAGYFAVQPLLATARSGQGGLSFAQLHGVSVAFFALKIGLVAALTWRGAGRGPSGE